MEAAREAVREAMAEATKSKSKKKKRGRGGASDSDDAGGGSGSDSDGTSRWRRRKKKKKQSQEEEEEDEVQKARYRDRAKERRSGNAGFEDVSAYLSQNIVEAGASDAVVVAPSAANAADSTHAVEKKKKKRKATVSLGDRILRVLRSVEIANTSSTKSKKNAKKRRAGMARWMEGGLVYHFDVTPGLDPRTYTDSMAIPTEVLHGDDSRADAGIRLTDRESNPVVRAELLNAVSLGFRRAQDGLKDVHPALLKQQQRQKALELQKAKEAIQQKLAEQSKRVMTATTTPTPDDIQQKNQDFTTANGAGEDSKEDDDDDIFADVGDYQPSGEEGEHGDAGNGDSNGADETMDNEVLLGKDAGLSKALDIRVNGILYYSKPGQGIDTVRVLKMHPGLPAPTESLTVRVVASFDAQRVGRELNLLPDSNKLSSVRPVDPSLLALMLPPQFRQRCTSTAVSDELAWIRIEVDLCDYVLKDSTSNTS